MTIGKGLAAGFVATVVLSMLMLMKDAMAIMPQLDVIGMISGMLGLSKIAAWVVHFVIGTVVWGGLFVATYAYLPGQRPWLKGVALGLIGWVAMMIVMMPMAGKGIFGMQLGIMAPLMTMMLHVIFGAVMGLVYGMLIDQDHESRIKIETGGRPSV
ncbi:MAG: DUF6789 family protein [Afipia sp.]|nr:DUF6789 family protein [Afipia sp.]